MLLKKAIRTPSIAGMMLFGSVWPTWNKPMSFADFARSGTRCDQGINGERISRRRSRRPTRPEG